MTHFTIGIDTGGTYTDAVIIDAKSHSIIASAKALTTKGDLSIGVMQSLERVLNASSHKIDRAAISMVCLSTTLATNSLVEGHGSSVGVFLIGFDDAMVERSDISNALPSTKIFRFNGGHIYTGEERAPLALSEIETALLSEAGKMDAYSVTTRYATRNSSHEQLVKKLIHEKTTCPVTASCEVSSSLNDPRRALTATLNASIISLIKALESAVRNSLKQLGINARIMIVKGDGSIANTRAVRHKPIETILSGPAASVIGARFLSGFSDFVIADIGGTTSDVAIIKKGWPTLNEHGLDIGGFPTLVRAIDIHTAGLGGDSEVLLDSSGAVQLDTNRVIPISMLATRWPWIEAQMAQALSRQRGMLHAFKYIVLPDGTENNLQFKNIAPKDYEFIVQLSPHTPRRYVEMIDNAADRARLPRLLRLGLVQVSGLTPSDAAHVLGRQSQWSSKAAELACELMGRAAGKIDGHKPQQKCKAFAEEIVDTVIAKSSKLVIERLANTTFNNDNLLLKAVTHNNGQLADLDVSITPRIKVVAVGGPASVFYPDVGKRLGVNITIPKGHEVANAIGAAMSMIKVRALVEITYAEKGGYLIHHQDKPFALDDASAAIECASKLAHDQAKYEAQAMGGKNISINIKVDRIDIPGLSEETKLMAATITAEVLSEAEV